MRYKFTKKNDIDKLDPYLKFLLHMLVNKPLTQEGESKIIFLILVDHEKVDLTKKKLKKGKKN